MSDNAGPRQGSDAQELRARKSPYLVAPVPSHLLPAGVEPHEPEALFSELDRDPEIHLHRRIKVPEESSGRPDKVPFPHMAVATMHPDRAAELIRDPRVQIQRDHHVRLLTPSPASSPTAAGPGVGLRVGPVTTVTFLVSGSDGAPLADADVVVLSPEGNFQGKTGPDGRVALDLTVHDLTAVTGVYVEPAEGHWESWTDHPELSTDSPNLVVLRPLTETFPGFPDRQVRGWGISAMGLDQIPPNYRGQGVKVALIDSGAAADHDDLAGRITGGVDLVAENDSTWSVDMVGHGTHCAGVVTGADNARGIVGIAVEAEVHVIKIFPRGFYRDIITALHYCVEHEIDVVNLSFGGPESDPFVTQAIELAREAGVACIAASGNNGPDVQFPARLPSVLAVGAIGKLGQFPPGTHHAQQVWGQPDAEGYFSAAFSCSGPEVDVCAPGVAILSSVPGGWFAMDGTSMGAPHVAGLATLLLAHHPDFQNGYAKRDANRVDRLFSIIKASCTPLDFGAPERTGAGLPDARRAFALAAPPAATAELAELRQAMRSAGLLPVSSPATPGSELDQLTRLLQAAGLLPVL
jgi:subtilisin family serine protease